MHRYVKLFLMRWTSGTTEQLDIAQKALGVSPLRTQILQLANRERSFTAQMVVEETGASRSAVERHLKEIAEARLLTRERRTQPRGAGSEWWWALDRDALDEATASYLRALNPEP